MWTWMHDGGWWWFGAFWMVVFWGVVIWAIATFTRRTRSDGRARELLDERFARGEIDETEYRHSRELIKR